MSTQERVPESGYEQPAQQEELTPEQRWLQTFKDWVTETGPVLAWDNLRMEFKNEQVKVADDPISDTRRKFTILGDAINSVLPDFNPNDNRQIYTDLQVRLISNDQRKSSFEKDIKAAQQSGVQGAKEVTILEGESVYLRGVPPEARG